LLVKKKESENFSKNSSKVKSPCFRVSEKANNMEANSYFHFSIMPQERGKGYGVFSPYPSPLPFNQESEHFPL